MNWISSFHIVQTLEKITMAMHDINCQFYTYIVLLIYQNTTCMFECVYDVSQDLMSCSKLGATIANFMYLCC